MKHSFWIIAATLSLYFCLFSVEKINLVTADIGRHVKNGGVFIHSAEFGISKYELLHTNLFSYTYPDYPFINHHWGSGVLSYLIYSISGFKGLSLVYVSLLILSLLFALWTMRDDTNLSTTFLSEQPVNPQQKFP